MIEPLFGGRSGKAQQRLALRPREAAAALGVSERTLWAWTDEGRVPHLRVGRTLLYPVDGLRHWLEAASGEAGRGDAGSQGDGAAPLGSQTVRPELDVTDGGEH